MVFSVRRETLQNVHPAGGGKAFGSLGSAAVDRNAKQVLNELAGGVEKPPVLSVNCQAATCLDVDIHQSVAGTIGAK
jgi:hypothetical protein